ncbi:hypothetical protein ACFL5Q_00020 [Planctomycetota bacterium]
MTRAEIIEAMARAAWEHSDEPEPWDELSTSIRADWVSYQDAALTALEVMLPSLPQLIAESHLPERSN